MRLGELNVSDETALTQTRAAGRQSVVVAICTRNRPQLLRSCLESVLGLVVPPRVQPCIVVVENDALPTCRCYVESCMREAPEPWKIVYGHEPNLGIPLARNLSVEIALGEDPDWIAFIDDDEVVDPQWLERMIGAAHELDCDVLQGPVEYSYQGALPEWFDTKETKQRRRGERLRTAYTNNLFMKSRVVRADGLALRFDEAMRFSGGSDSDFFFRAVDGGASICWVDDAFVREIVAAQRVSITWQWMRALRVAANAATIHKKRRGPLAAWIRYLPKSLMRLLRGAGQMVCGVMVFLPSSALGKKWLVRGGKDAASGIGSIIGLLGLTPQPYKTVD